MAYYYPEGYFGPVCDSLVDDDTIASSQRRAIVVDDARVDIFPPVDDDFWDATKDIYEPAPPFLLRTRCKVDADGNYYDCENEYVGKYPTLDPPLVPIDTLIRDIGIKDKFFVPNLTAESCSPYDPDTNILPITTYSSSGQGITKYKKERSSPVTFPVSSILEFVVSESDLTAEFTQNSLIVSGTGTGNLYLSFEWDDNPDTNDTALGEVIVAGVTFAQDDSDETGEDSATVEVTPQTYPLTVLNSTGGYEIQDNGTKICFRDEDGDDCNATLRIDAIESNTTTANVGYWSEEGNNYAVWVNPATCTLPQEEQVITYLIDIPSTDTYAFRFACDDNAQLFLNDETSPILDISGGIFSSGSLSTPYTATRTLTAGVLKVTVRVTNSDAGFVDGNGAPTGLAYSWERNPGGYFLKICRGTGCLEQTIIQWVRSGPHQSWGSFMNTYAVYPSNTEVLSGTAHAATWNINIPTAGDYVLEYSVDDDGTWSFDGTQVASSGNNQGTSDTVTISSVTAGSHSVSVTVTNNSSVGSDWSSNPGGIAWTLTNTSTSTIVASSLDLRTPGDGNLIWHTRMATGYEYYTL